MKAKITLMIELDDEKLLFFENGKNLDYNDVEELLQEVTIRAEENLSQKKS